MSSSLNDAAIMEMVPVLYSLSYPTAYKRLGYWSRTNVSGLRELYLRSSNTAA